VPSPTPSRLLKENPNGRQDRKSALELAIILKDLQDTKSMIRWVPHQKMLVDCLTKESLERGNGPLQQFLRSGWLSLVDVSEELRKRKEDPAFKNRSHRASSERARREFEAGLQAFCHHFLTVLVGPWKSAHVTYHAVNQSG
jgi:hypothetical protein